MTTAIQLQNEWWQFGVLPQTGASVAFGRVRRGNAWVGILRSTAPADYGNSSSCSSFIMLPWCNRIRGAVLHFDSQAYPLKAEPDDGTARHGDVRKRPWTVTEYSDTHVRLRFDSRDHQAVNFPFLFSTEVEYRLQDTDCIVFYVRPLKALLTSCRLK